MSSVSKDALEAIEKIRKDAEMDRLEEEAKKV